MLGLHYETPATWARNALAKPGELLLDHYFCELKAAAMAQRTLRLYGPKFPKLKPLMRELAAEEALHADQVKEFLRQYPHEEPKRGGDKYAQELRRAANLSGNGSLLDLLLVCSLIEARSAERFKLLADEAHGGTLGNFYADLYAAEVNHYKLFVQLAADHCGPERATQRLEELRAAEAAIIKSLPEGARIH